MPEGIASLGNEEHNGIRSTLSSIVALSLSACADACPDVRAIQPDVPEGGRAFAIAMRPDNDEHMIVASETGGLFRSTDAGVTWDHLGFFPSHFVHDVTYASLAPKIVDPVAPLDNP